MVGIATTVIRGWKYRYNLMTDIVKIDSITPSFCLRHYVYSETRPTLCKPTPSSQLGIRSKRTNKHQLLHRIASVKTPLTYNTESEDMKWIVHGSVHKKRSETPDLLMIWIISFFFVIRWWWCLRRDGNLFKAIK